VINHPDKTPYGAARPGPTLLRPPAASDAAGS